MSEHASAPNAEAHESVYLQEMFERSFAATLELVTAEQAADPRFDYDKLVLSDQHQRYSLYRSGMSGAPYYLNERGTWAQDLEGDEAFVADRIVVSRASNSQGDTNYALARFEQTDRDGAPVAYALKFIARDAKSPAQGIRAERYPKHDFADVFQTHMRLVLRGEPMGSGEGVGLSISRIENPNKTYVLYTPGEARQTTRIHPSGRVTTSASAYQGPFFADGIELRGDVGEDQNHVLAARFYRRETDGGISFQEHLISADNENPTRDMWESTQKVDIPLAESQWAGSQLPEDQQYRTSW